MKTRWMRIDRKKVKKLLIIKGQDWHFKTVGCTWSSNCNLGKWETQIILIKNAKRVLCSHLKGDGNAPMLKGPESKHDIFIIEKKWKN